VIKEHHPYQTPEIIALPVEAGSAEYLSWLGLAVKNPF
jgi:periplasmic divalent cation tolerance protein